MKQLLSIIALLFPVITCPAQVKFSDLPLTTSLTDGTKFVVLQGTGTGANKTAPATQLASYLATALAGTFDAAGAAAAVQAAAVPATRTVNGQALSSDIVVSAASNTLSGTTLASNVTASSLASLSSAVSFGDHAKIKWDGGPFGGTLVVRDAADTSDAPFMCGTLGVAGTFILSTGHVMTGGYQTAPSLRQSGLYLGPSGTVSWGASTNDSASDDTSLSRASAGVVAVNGVAIASAAFATIDTDLNLTANSDTKIPSQKAVKAALSGKIGGSSGTMDAALLVADGTEGHAARATGVAVDEGNNLTLPSAAGIKLYSGSNNITLAPYMTYGGLTSLQLSSSTGAPALAIKPDNGGGVVLGQYCGLELGASAEICSGAGAPQTQDIDTRIGRASASIWQLTNGGRSQGLKVDVSGPDTLLTSIAGTVKVNGFSVGSAAEAALDTDVSLTDNSDTKVPSQKAVKAYVDANSGGTALSTPNEVWLSDAGNDSTGAVGDPARPFITLQAALDASGLSKVVVHLAMRSSDESYGTYSNWAYGSAAPINLTFTGGGRMTAVNIRRTVACSGLDTISSLPGVGAGSLTFGGENGASSSDSGSPGGNGVPVNLWLPCWTATTSIINVAGGTGGAGFDDGMDNTPGGNGGAVSVTVGNVTAGVLNVYGGAGGGGTFVGGNGASLVFKAIEKCRIDAVGLYCGNGGGSEASTPGSPGDVSATIFDLGPRSYWLTSLAVADPGTGSLILAHSRVNLQTSGLSTLTYGNNVLSAGSAFSPGTVYDHGGNSTGW